MAQTIGLDAYIDLIKHYGGSQLYIPTIKMVLMDEILKRIISEYKVLTKKNLYGNMASQKQLSIEPLEAEVQKAVYYKQKSYYTHIRHFEKKSERFKKKNRQTPIRVLE